MKRKTRFRLTFSALFIYILLGSLSADGQNAFSNPIQTCWKFTTESAGSLPIASDNVNSLFYALSDGSLLAFDAKTGQKNWQSDLGGEIVSPVIFDANKLFVLTSGVRQNPAEPHVQTSFTVFTTQNLKYINAVSPLTGVSYWQRKISAGGRAYLTVDSANLVILTDLGELYIVDKESGIIRSEKALNVEVTSPPVIVSHTLYFGIRGDKLFRQRLDGDIEADRSDIGLTARILYLSAENKVYAGDEAGNIRAYRTDKKGVLWKARTGAAITGIRDSGAAILVSSSDNYVYLLSKKGGGIIWKKRLSGRNLGELAILENVAFLSPLGTGEVILVDLKQGKTINQISVSEHLSVGSPLLLGDYIIMPTESGLLGLTYGKCAVEK